MRPDQALDPLVRFVGLVEFTDTCWLWCGKFQAGGYGQFSVGSRTTGTRRLVYAHRFAYEAMIGPIPPGLVIDHLCRVRPCVHPDHLEAVTQKENTMRGDTLTARNAAKSQCPKGHPYSAENTSTVRNRRVCITCKRASSAVQNAKRAERLQH